MSLEKNPRSVVTKIFVDLFIKQSKTLPKNKKLNNTKIENFAMDIEKGIYNKAIKFADDNNMSKKWDNQLFLDMYKAFSISIYSNLDISLNVFNF